MANRRIVDRVALCGWNLDPIEAGVLVIGPGEGSRSVSHNAGCETQDPLRHLRLEALDDRDTDPVGYLFP